MHGEHVHLGLPQSLVLPQLHGGAQVHGEHVQFGFSQVVVLSVMVGAFQGRLFSPAS